MFKRKAFNISAIALILSAAVAMIVAACGGGAPTATSQPQPTATHEAMVEPTATSASMSTTATPRPTTAPPPTATAVPTPAGGVPKYGGVLRTGTEVFMPRFDAHLNVSPADIRDISRLQLNGLIRMDIRSLQLKPELAESWTVDNTGSITFKLRPGVRFHNRAPVNGRVLTAQDVKWNFDRMLTHPQSILKARLRPVQSVDVIDGSTVKFVTKEVDANLLFQIAFEQMVIYPQEAAIDGFFDDPRTQIGSGPFLGTLLQNPGQNRFARNPAYWRKSAAGAQLPYLDGVEYAIQIDRAAVAALMKTQGLDWAPIRNFQDAKFFIDRSDSVVIDTTGEMVGIMGLMLNVSIPPFDDIRLREALRLTVDQQEILDIVLAGQGFFTGPLGAREDFGHWGQAKLRTLPGYRSGADKATDIAEAKRLLADAGVPNGFTFQINARGASLSDAAKLMNQQWAVIGVEGEHQATTNSAYETTAFAKDKQSTWYNEGAGVTPDHALTKSYLPFADKNSIHWDSPELDALFLKEVALVDFAKRAVVIEEIQQLLWDNVLHVPDVRNLTWWTAWGYVKNWARPEHGYHLSAPQIDEIWIDKG